LCQWWRFFTLAILIGIDTIGVIPDKERNTLFPIHFENDIGNRVGIIVVPIGIIYSIPDQWVFISGIKFRTMGISIIKGKVFAYGIKSIRT
jgi:hypothetical protein